MRSGLDPYRLPDRQLITRRSLILKDLTGFLHVLLSQSILTRIFSPGANVVFSSVMVDWDSEVPRPAMPPTLLTKDFWRTGMFAPAEAL